MTTYRGEHAAPGGPGTEPHWEHADKDGVGCAYSASSRLWYTLRRGPINEVYYPQIDRPQLLSLEYLLVDKSGSIAEEGRDFGCHVELINGSLGYRVRGSVQRGRVTIDKDVISDPHLPCLLQHTRLGGDPGALEGATLYVVCRPRLEGGGAGNNGYVVESAGRRLLVAERKGTWLALAASVPFAALSCGFEGVNDGHTDLLRHQRLTWNYDRALDGNIVLTAAIDPNAHPEFTVCLAFGHTLQSALSRSFVSLSYAFFRQRERFLEQWARTDAVRAPLDHLAGDGGKLYRTSYNLLMAHEDKSFQGAIIASLSIPWGEARGDEDGAGGYHLVWPRDLVQAAAGLLAAGNYKTPRRTAIYLATNQRPDGSFPQNFWIDGRAHWKGLQLDEVSFPVLLAYHIWRAGFLHQFDPYAMVMRAAGFLVRKGPVTQQERWEETGGYSPSTLAVNIAALLCAAAFARDRNEAAAASVLEVYADFLERHLELWTTTRSGTLVEGVARHYVRLRPAAPGEPLPEREVEGERLPLPARAPGEPTDYPARDVVDAGFLELVRYGIRDANDPLIVDSVRVVDEALKVDTPAGPAWRRYSHDNYGQRPDGGPFIEHGRGRAWPLLTGERAHYELAAGRDVRPFIAALEAFSTETRLLPEQIWDEPDLPEGDLRLGGPTGSAVPLVWAHAEYIKLLRSVYDGRVFDRIAEVAARYTGEHPRRGPPYVIWSFHAPARRLALGVTLRVQAEAPFRLRWWAGDEQRDVTSIETPFGVYYADLPAPARAGGRLSFTFFWPSSDRWEGRDFDVEIDPAP